METPLRLMEVRNEGEGAEVCERLRRAGVKCAVEQLPDANSASGIWGIPAPDALFVLVNEDDVARARAALKP